MMGRRFGLTLFSLEFVVCSLKFGFLPVGTLVFWLPAPFFRGPERFALFQLDFCRTECLLLVARGDTFSKGVTSD